MKKNVKVQKEGFIQLSDFADLVDTKKVKYYTIDAVHDAEYSTKTMVAVLKFYDKNKKLIRTKA